MNTTVSTALTTLLTADVESHGPATEGPIEGHNSDRTELSVSNRGGLAGLTLEQRAEINAKARAAQRAAHAARQASTLRRDFMDAWNWDELAKRYGVRLPPWGQPADAPTVRRILSRAGVSFTEYRDWSGTRKLTDWATLNPDWPARALAGTILEAIESGHLRLDRA